MARGGATSFKFSATGVAELVVKLNAMEAEVDDMKEVYGDIARRAAQYVRVFAPARTGRLARSARPTSAKGYASVSVGNSRLRYAGPINYGWPRRNIKRSQFLQRADTAMQPVIAPMLQAGVDRIIAKKGLS